MDELNDSNQGPISNSAENRPNSEIKRRSIRDIKRGEKPRPGGPSEPPVTDVFPERHYKSTKRSYTGIIALGVFVVLFAFFGFSALFTHAEVEITPRQETINGQTSLRATLNPEENTDITYAVVNLKVDGTKTVQASGKEEVEEKAAGAITIYNSFSEESQTFVATTRFAAPDGRIYRVPESVTIPGTTVVNGEKIPGKLENVRVFADQAGDKYNGKIEGKFTVPGLEGSPQYDGFYAEATSEFTGGFVGTKAVANEEDEERAYEVLETELTQKLTSEDNSKIPSGFVVVGTLGEPTFDRLPSNGSGDTVELKAEASAKVVVLPVGELASILLKRSKNETVNSTELTISNANVVTVHIANEEEVEVGDALSLEINGPVEVEWIVDPDKVETEIAGLRLSEVDRYIESNKSVSAISVDLSPFWKRSLPEDPEKIDTSVAGQDKETQDSAPKTEEEGE